MELKRFRVSWGWNFECLEHRSPQIQERGICRVSELYISEWLRPRPPPPTLLKTSDGATDGGRVFAYALRLGLIIEKWLSLSPFNPPILILEFEAVLKRQFVSTGKQRVAKTLPPLRTSKTKFYAILKSGGEGGKET